MLFLVDMPKGVWEWFIGQVFGGIPNYGLRIVVFTLILRIALLPVDFFQRKSLSDNAKKMKILQPQIKKLQDQFGHDRNLLGQKQMELYRKEKYNMFSSCLPMFISMVVFFTMYAGFTNISHYTNMQTYQNLYNEYHMYYDNTVSAGYTPYGLDKLQSYLDELREEKGEEIYLRATGTESERQAIVDFVFTATTSDLTYKGGHTSGSVFNKNEAHLDAVVIARERIAQDAVINLYEQHEKQGFIGLIKSVWVSDVFWQQPIPNKDGFKSSLNRNALVGGNAGKGYLNEFAQIIDEYDAVMAGLTVKYSGVPNGYLIFVVLCGGFSVLSQLITTRQQKKATPQADGQAAQMGQSMSKMMLIMMPAMLIMFAVTAPAAFTIYMVCNSAFGLAFSQAIGYVIKRWDAYSEKKELETVHTIRRGK